MRAEADALKGACIRIGVGFYWCLELVNTSGPRIR